MFTCEALSALKMWQNRNQVQSPHTPLTPHTPLLPQFFGSQASGADWPWTVSWRWAAGVCFRISGCPGCCGSRRVQKDHRWSQTCVKGGQHCEVRARGCQVPGQRNYSGSPQRQLMSSYTEACRAAAARERFSQPALGGWRQSWEHQSPSSEEGENEKTMTRGGVSLRDRTVWRTP